MMKIHIRDIRSAIVSFLVITAILICCGVGSAMSNGLDGLERLSFNGKGIDIDKIIDLFVESKTTGDVAKLKVLTAEEKTVLMLRHVYIMLDSVPGNAITNPDQYELFMQIADFFADGVETIDSIGTRKGLYLYENEIEMTPLKWLLAETYNRSLQIAAADSIYILLPEDIKRDYGEDSEEFVFWSNQCGTAVNRKLYNYEKALKIMTPALQTALTSERVKDSTACEFLISYAQKKNRMGKHSEALKYAREASLKCGENKELLYIVHKTLGELYGEKAMMDESAKHFAIAAQNYSNLSEFLSNSLSYSNALRNSGKAEDALSLLLQLEKYVDSDELDNQDKFNYYESLGSASSFLKPELSKEAFSKAEGLINYQNMSTAIRYLLNSEVYTNDDNTFKIIDALSRAEQCYNLVGLDDSRLLVEILYLNGHYLLMIKDLDNAYKYLDAALGYSFEFADSDPISIRIVSDLASLYEQRGDSRSQKVWLDCLLNITKSYGETSKPYLDAMASCLDFALTSNDRETAFKFLKEYRNARPDDFTTKCFNIRFDLESGNLPKAINEAIDLYNADEANRNITVGLCESVLARGRDKRIVTFAKENLALFKSQTARQLLFMNSEERKNLLQYLALRRNTAICEMPITEGLNEVALEYSLFSKGLLLNTHRLVEQNLSINDSAKSELQKISQLRQDLQRAEMEGNGESARGIRYGIGQRERYLIDDFADEEGIKQELAKMSYRSVRDRLASSALAIDIVKFEDEGKERYGAFVFSRDCEIPLFIEINSSARTAYEGLWSKLEPYFDGYKDIYFSADGRLNNMAIEFAPDKEGVPMNQKYRLHRVFHLGEIAGQGDLGDKIVVVGVSDHNSPIGHGDKLMRGSWADLRGVEEEIENLKTNLSEKAPVILFNDDASEENVKHQFNEEVTALHISTHGVYRSRAYLYHSANNPEDDDYNIARRVLNVGKTSLSGLILRQGNLSWKAAELADGEDDILTAEEIEMMSMPNLRLTVLSACDSGLGEVDSEGVWGLQRAFRIAGCKNLICSLRKIDDYWTAQFMNEFYTHAVKGNTIYDSFQHAQKALYEADLDSPEIWSSFILIE